MCRSILFFLRCGGRASFKRLGIVWVRKPRHGEVRKVGMLEKRGIRKSLGIGLKAHKADAAGGKRYATEKDVGRKAEKVREPMKPEGRMAEGRHPPAVLADAAIGKRAGFSLIAKLG